MANQVIVNPGRVFDANGYVSPGAKVTFYATGTTTLISVYSDAAQTIPEANPVIADADGVLPQRYVAVAAKAVISDADDVVMYTIDPVPVVQSTGSGASQISFEPTVDLPYTNVQDAVEGAGALAVSGFATYGIGIAGNATLLANLDSTVIGGGVYRFDGTTTGTFPSGVVAADTGLVESWRQTSATAMQALYHATTDRVFHRRMASTTWGTWREVLTVNQGATEGDIIYRGASAWTRLAKGTAGQLLRQNSGLTAPEWSDGSGTLTNGTTTATTSGTTKDITGIPSWAKRISVALAGVSTNGTSAVILQLGTSGGIISTGYTSNAGNSAVTNGFAFFGTSASDVRSGVYNIMNLGSGLWVCSVSGKSAGAAGSVFGGGGDLTGAGTIDRVRLTTVGGTDTFDAGSFNVFWE